MLTVPRSHGSRPARDGGDAGVDDNAAAGSRDIPSRLAADVDAGGSVGTGTPAGMRGPALVVVDAGARNDVGGGAGGGTEITCRWPIEAYHLTLKSGCRIEGLRLEKWDSLEKAAVMYTSVAARIVALRDRAAQEPDAPATGPLSEDECAVLVAKFGQGPGQAVLRLTLGQAVLWIARLGGHLNRQRDGMPGVRTLWRGLRDLTLLVEGWRVARRLEIDVGNGQASKACSSSSTPPWSRRRRKTSMWSRPSRSSRTSNWSNAGTTPSISDGANPLSPKN